MRTPIWKPFMDDLTRGQRARVKRRALCPAATTTASESSVSPPASLTPRQTLSRITIPSTRVSQRNVPPSDSIFARSDAMMPGRRSEPRCGWLKYRMDGSAPQAANVSRTYITAGSWMRVKSFPSDHVPAPPSP